MSTEKRRFYNTGEAKGFKKRDFFETVLAVLTGEEVSDEMIALVIKGAEYELEGMDVRAAKSSAEAKDPLQSEYAIAVREAMVPLVTAEPQTADAMIQAATDAGNLSPKGKPFANTWVHRVLQAEPGIQKVQMKVMRTSKEGLQGEVLATGYKLG